ncbi:CehA/McbA family metallohydrolase [Massilia sp. YIM B02763]|uniref:CehA/McbA family metallohydrolase n=1 Tax=Massilia sp. YIM B02763 TaxID=3050130 RepID=UPI0025B6DD0B|nr:CehA/McbA family metallohydrolase [Massilia sp. YIM B02763]MDN4055990.1 CehA/McbA family metallohydrolase [Massilia sp. YIM B02763]
MKTLSFLLPLALAAAGSINVQSAIAAVPVVAAQHEHRELDATLHAPYRGDGRGQPDARTFTLAFDYPGLAGGEVAWRLELLAPKGRRVGQWQGRQALAGGRPASVAVRWQGLVGGARPAAGIYRVRLHARVAGEEVEQAWDIAVGTIAAPSMPPFAGLPTRRTPLHDTLPAAPAPDGLPYTVYYGNLHSQTSHSDGGAPVDDCHGAQEPQSAPFGPDAAWPYAWRHGLDILMVSEHNHMYDGSSGTRTDADPLAAKALYRAGLDSARAFNAAHKDFLALYGLEWGVIGNGGHLNIFNGDALLGWEKTGKGDLLADVETARGDYGALYSLMQRRGWIGQFNHPALTGQFAVGGQALAYTPEGDAAMALCEVMNSSAFSTSENEGETRRSNFEQACNKLLEAGYHVAFSSNQDNHCANWGASAANRTAVLIPNGVPLTRDSFVEALRARRVFATMDKDAQLVLTANGHLMGERFANSGPLRLLVRFAGAPGRTAAAVEIVEGVPGRGGEVATLPGGADVQLAPAPGPHFYYAKVTQDDGRILWSAPVWVDQSP